MVRYSLEEQIDMFNIYTRHYRNSVLSARIYGENFPERHQPDRTTFVRIYRNFKNTGGLRVSRGNYQHHNDQNSINVLAQIHINPQVSSREISRECGVSDSTVRKIIKRQGFHDYKYLPVQKLYPEDFRRRSVFCHWLQENIGEDPLFHRKILWTDESTFTNQGMFNRKNKHFYATKNPNLYQEVRTQIRYSVNVWCGILDDRILGPFFIPGNLNAQTYLHFLQTNLEEYLDNLPLRNLRDLQYFQQDGCPAHNALIVADYLDLRFPNSWIGTRGPVAWPPRSPCLNPLDYFLWGCLKNKVYETPVPDREELIRRISVAARSISPVSIRAAVGQLRGRIRLCVQNNGGHISHLLDSL